MAGGMKYEEIAAKLFISLNTVRSHVKAIYAKFGVDNRTRAIEMGRQKADSVNPNFKKSHLLSRRRSHLHVVCAFSYPYKIWL